MISIDPVQICFDLDQGIREPATGRRPDRVMEETWRWQCPKSLQFQLTIPVLSELRQFGRRRSCCGSFVDDRLDRPGAPPAFRAAAKAAVNLGHTRRNV